MKTLPPDAQLIMNRAVGRTMERLEKLRIEDPVLVAMIKDTVRKEMRFLAENMHEAYDGK